MIRFQCKCGKSFEVKDELAGKKARCNKCQAVVAIPELAIIEAEEVEDDYGLVDDLVPIPADAPRVASFDPAMQREIEQMQKMTQSAASNPGGLRVSHLKYATSYPFFPVLWSVPLVLSSLGLLLSWCFVPLVMMFALPLGLWAWIVRKKFASGCLLPAVVVKLDPPIVAVLSDLRKGDDWGAWPVIKFVRQPLNRMTGGPPALGQRVACIATYCDGEEYRWEDFYPDVVNCLTFNQREIERCQNSLSESDFQELSQALAKLPQPHPTGNLHRVGWPHAKKGRPLNPSIVSQFVEQSAGNNAAVRGIASVATGIRPDLLTTAIASYAPQVRPEEVIAIYWSSQPQHGLLVTAQGMYYSLSDGQRGEFAWADCRGAFCNKNSLQLLLNNNQRLKLPVDDFAMAATSLEYLITLITLTNGILTPDGEEYAIG